MANKKIFIKISLLVAFIGLFGSSFTSATFNIDLRQTAGIIANSFDSITKKITPIHFADNGNDFGGFLYFSDLNDYEEDISCNEESCGKYTVEINNGTSHNIYECQHEVSGFYYNAERGDRLRPIDSDTMNAWIIINNNERFSFSGGLYTKCVVQGLAQALAACTGGDGDAANDEGDESNEDEGQCESDARARYGNLYGYYGSISHTYTPTFEDGDSSGQEEKEQFFGLIAGVEYNSGSEHEWATIKEDSILSESFIRYNNQYPVGLVYDYHGGVGLVGCESVGSNKSANLKQFINLMSWNSLGELFKESDNPDQPGLVYTGGGALNCINVGSVANSLINIIVEGLVGMSSDVAGNDIAIIGNQTNSKMQYFNSVNVNNATLVNYIKRKAELLCMGRWEKVYMRGGTSNAFIGASDNWKNISKADGLYCIDGGMGYAITGATIVVKNGNVVVPTMDRNSFDNGDYYDIFIDGGNLLIKEGNKYVFTKEGVLSDKSIEEYKFKLQECSGTCTYTGDDVAVASFIKGNFIVNGRLGSEAGGTVDNNGSLDGRYFIYGKFTTKDTFDDLKKLSTWKCFNGMSSDTIDEVYCPVSVPRLGWINPYEGAALIVIDQNYDSPLFW